MTRFSLLTMRLETRILIATSFTVIWSGISRRSKTHSTVLKQSMNSSGCVVSSNLGISILIPMLHRGSSHSCLWNICGWAKGFSSSSSVSHMLVSVSISSLCTSCCNSRSRIRYSNRSISISPGSLRPPPLPQPAFLRGWARGRPRPAMLWYEMMQSKIKWPKTQVQTRERISSAAFYSKPKNNDPNPKTK